MTPQALLATTLSVESTKENTDFVEVVHRGATRKAKVEYGDFRKIGKTDMKDQYIQDEISFLGMATVSVSYGDKITYKTVDYAVKHFQPIVDGYYNIFARKKVRTGRL